jgi:hypothetical protein
LEVVEEIAGRSESLISRPIRVDPGTGKPFLLPRYLFIGPAGGDNPLRVGLFGGIHGDEPEGVDALMEFLVLLDQQPDLARGYCLFVYPICNPSGYEDGTRHTRRGRDLNREFWNGSEEPEIVVLQRELVHHAFDGVISLHEDSTCEGVYGYARGATIAENLLVPALRAAEVFIARDRRPRIDGFNAFNGIIRDCFEGVLSPPPVVRPRPFEVILETPQQADALRQRNAMVAALRVMLEEYRALMAYSPNL